MNDLKVSELTVGELQQLIRHTVQEAVVEVLIEFNAAARAEEELRYEAEMTDYLRSTLQGLSRYDLRDFPKLDD